MVWAREMKLLSTSELHGDETLFCVLARRKLIEELGDYSPPEIHTLAT